MAVPSAATSALNLSLEQHAVLDEIVREALQSLAEQADEIGAEPAASADAFWPSSETM